MAAKRQLSLFGLGAVIEDHGVSVKELTKVLTFKGYGNKCAPYWFLEIEEGAGWANKILISESTGRLTITNNPNE